VLKKRRSLLGALVLSLAVAAQAFAASFAAAAPGEVLILEPTVSGGASSTLAQKFALAGKTPVLVSPAQWSTMTAADFTAYDAIALGDPTCQFLGPEAAATANAATWSSVVDGNVVVIGTDETFHQVQGGADLMEKAAAFTVAQPAKTGAYISLSCYYHDTAPGTPVPLLGGFGNFTATGVGCFNDAHIVATHPALVGLTDATLSNWSCSVHEAFDAWPVSFEVLAIARGIGTSFTAPDGTVGTPYILARGVEVISDIRLAPETASNDVGTSHTLTATVTKDDPAPGTPVVGTTVTFTVIDGPHAGTTGTGVTNSSGVATFAYTGTSLGEDTIEATFVDSLGRTQRSNRVKKIWVERTNECPYSIGSEGFGQPINNAAPFSVFKLGSTIPVKVTILDCHSAVVNGLSPDVDLVRTDSTPDGAVNEVVSSSAADTGDNMRDNDSFYMFNLSTKRSQFNSGADLTPGTYRLTVDDSDSATPAFAPLSGTINVKK